MITIPEEKRPSLKKIGHIQQKKILNQELRTTQYLGYHENV